jgi:hypothetical protein
MRHLIRSLLLVCSLQAAIPAGDAPSPPTPPDPAQLAQLQELASPEGQVKLWLKMFRQNDFSSLTKLIPEKEWVMVERAWRIQLAKQGTKADAELDQQLALLKTPNALDTIMAQLKPQLATLKPEDLGNQLRGLGALAATFAQSQGDAGRNFDVQGFQSYISDVADWVQKAGLNDADKARKALEKAIACIQALQIGSAQELRQNKLQDMLPRFGKALIPLKDMFRTYDVNIDNVIDSVKIEKMVGQGNRRTMTTSFNVFGKTRQLDFDLIKRGSTWEILGGQGQPFGPFGPMATAILKAGGIGGNNAEKIQPPEEQRPPGTL